MMNEDSPAATIENLNASYAVEGAVSFAAGPGGLPIIELRNDLATATIDLLGATVTAYQPAGQAPVLWVSRHSELAVGRAIRGGIPVCWPWFGPHPSDSSLPNHGFVRTRMWRVLETGTVGDGANEESEVRLGLESDETTLALWPQPFAVQLVVRVGRALRVSLEAQNTGEMPYTMTGALHSYLAVGEVGRITLLGLEGTRYVDKVGGSTNKEQSGPLTIDAETDRIYVETAATVTVDDPVLGRQIAVAKDGSRTTVVWNPWQDRAQRLPDFGDQEYREMVCVEAVNALDDAVTLAPGATHRLQTTLSVLPKT